MASSSSSHAHDVLTCLWKLTKLSAESSIAAAAKYPTVSSSIFGAFLLYLFLPFLFWALFHSFPFLACLVVAAIWSHGKEENGRRNRSAAENGYISGGDDHRKYGRVHSVRQTRRPPPMQNNTTTIVFDKTQLTEEKPDPKEIKEVVHLLSCSSPSSSSSPTKRDHLDRNSDPSEDDITANENNKAVSDDDNEEDSNPKNQNEVVISDVETTKRLESLIARRRSRKLLNLEAQRKQLTTTERSDQTSSSNIGSLSLNRTSNNPDAGGGPHLHSPGSAPSILIPARSPFDIPYDPHEEKPDLTGDSFDQEFFKGSTRDFTYCRHESFSLGPFNNNAANDEGFDHKKTEVNDDGVEDQIKHVIRAIDINDPNDDGEKSQASIGSTSGSSSSSEEEEDKQVFRIDKETILKSLNSITRRSGVEEPEPELELVYVAESTERNVARLKDNHFFRLTANRHHLPSYSIASDLQVEVSEISSPPVTINDSISYQDDLDFSSTYESEVDHRITWDGEHDLWAGSSHPLQVEDDESRSGIDEVTEADIIRVGFSRIDGTDDIPPPESYHSSKRSTNLDDKIFKTLEKSLSYMSLRQVPEENSKSSKNYAVEEAKMQSSVLGNNDHPESSTRSHSEHGQSSIEATQRSDEPRDLNSEPRTDSEYGQSSIEEPRELNSEEAINSIEAIQSPDEPQEQTSISNVAVEGSTTSASLDSVLQLNVESERGSMSSFDWEEDAYHQSYPQIAEASSPTALQVSTISSDELNTSAAVEAEEENNKLVSEKREQETDIKPEVADEEKEATIGSWPSNINNEALVTGNPETADEASSNNDKNPNSAQSPQRAMVIQQNIMEEIEHKAVENEDQNDSSLNNGTKHEDYINELEDQEKEQNSIPSSLKQELEKNLDPNELAIAFPESEKKKTEDGQQIEEIEHKAVENEEKNDSSVNNGTKHEDYINELEDQEKEQNSIPSSLNQELEENLDPGELATAFPGSEQKKNEDGQQISIASSHIDNENKNLDAAAILIRSSQKNEGQQQCNAEDQDSKLNATASDLVDDGDTKDKARNLATDELPIDSSSASDSRIEDDYHSHTDISSAIT